jgi:hypothetical protein
MLIQTKLPSRGKIDPKRKPSKVPAGPVSQISPVPSSALDKLKALKNKIKPTIQPTQLPPLLEQPTIYQLPVYEPKPEAETETESDFSEFDHPRQSPDKVEIPMSQSFRQAISNFTRPKNKPDKPWVKNKTAASNPSDLEALFFDQD